MKNPEIILQDKEYADIPIFLSRLSERVSLVNRERIDEKDFKDLYGSETVQKDILWCADREKEFASMRENNSLLKQNQIWGETLEAFLHTQINAGHFFGKEAVGIKTSRFDDIKGGIDEVVALISDAGAAHFGLGIDYTFSNPGKKIERNCRDIKNGFMPEVKYFKIGVPGWHMRGALKTPRVVFGVSRDTIRKDLANWLENKEDEICKSNLQMLLLMQITDQLDYYGHIAPSGLRSHFIQAQERIEEIKKTKRKEGLQMGELKNDPVHQLLCRQLVEHAK